MKTSDTQLPFLDKEKRSLWIFIQNQQTQKDMSPSKPPQAMLEKYLILPYSQNLHDC